MKRVPFLLLSIFIFSSLLAQGDYQKGVSYYQQGQYDKAITEFNAILKEQPEYEFGHRMLGHCHLKLKHYDQSIEAFREAIRLKSDNLSSYQGLALAYFNSERYGEVVSTLTRAENLAKSPQDRYLILKMRGAAAFNRKDFALAARDLRAAVSIQRGDPKDVLQLGISQFQLGEVDEARKNLEQAQTLDPASEAGRYLARMNFRQAVVDIEAGRYQAAAQSLRDYVAKNPDDGEAWFNLGLSYQFSDNLKAAEEAYLRATRISPENADGFDRLGFVFEKTKRYQKALEAYQKAYSLKKDAAIQESVQRVKKRLEQGPSA